MTTNTKLSALAERLLNFNRGVVPEMLLYKYEAMAKNVFSFFRGTCHIFYEDLHQSDLPNSPLGWICGDLHLENFGSFLGENKLIYFDLNDFDEAILAPVSYELIRLLTSIYVAFESLKIEPEKADHLAKLFLKTYSETLSRGKAISIEPRTAKGIVCKFLTSASKSKAEDILRKRTIKRHKKLVLSLKDERHFKIKKELKKELYAHVTSWIESCSDGPYNYKVKGSVFRLAGTGSIGIKRYLFLLKSTNFEQKYLLIDMKQSTSSSLSPFISAKQPQFKNEADRIVKIQKRMQFVPPSLLSTTTFHGDSYVIQELQPVKDSIEFEMIQNSYRDLYQVISDMAVLTASSQIRSSGMQGSAINDSLAKFGNDGSWHQALLSYAQSYSKKMNAYYKRFKLDHKSKVFDPDPSRMNRSVISFDNKFE